jgi:hypothetical protein
VMGVASARRLVRAAMAGGRFSVLWDCCARESAGVAAAVAAEVRRKRRRFSMGAISVLAKIPIEVTRCRYARSQFLDVIC